MSWYLLEPREPLTLPQGSPIQFEADTVASLGFPAPSELAELLRPAAFVPMRGPLLCKLDGGRPEVLVPMARDALMIACSRIRFRPGEFWQPRQTGWEAGAPSPDEVAGKVPRRGWLAQSLDDGPAFWSDRAMRSWLVDSEQEAASLVVEEGLAAMDPALKGVGGAFSLRAWHKAWAGRLGLLVRCEELERKPGLVRVGREGRLARLSRASVDPTWPAPELRGDDARVVLLTPGVFEGEFGPEQIAGAPVGGCFSCKARWGTDGDRTAGRTTRPRYVLGAGSVFTVSLQGLDRAKWLAKVHFQEISSRVEDRRLGFGLAVVGAVGGCD